MPSSVYTTLYDFTASPIHLEAYTIFGAILPFPQSGFPWLIAAMLVFAFLSIVHRRIPHSLLLTLLWLGVSIGYTGGFLLSARWLDDVFVNLIHPYNLFHHGLFSTRMDSMANGTVEILYYALLAPFAGDRVLLIRADYALGWLLGLAHLLALHHLLRRVPLLPRFFVLAAFAVWMPVVQSFSSGYGNGAVTLLWLLGVIAILDNRRVPLAVLCALMPLFRPDAILYSVSLAIMDVLVYRRFALCYWIPTLLAPGVYALMVHQMYHQWVPTPVIFKRVSITEIIHAVPIALPKLLGNHLLGSLEKIACLVFAIFYLVVPPRVDYGIPRRAMRAMLISTLPVLLLFSVTGEIGYNPTNYRYYAIFDISLFLLGMLGVLSLLQRVRDYEQRKMVEASLKGMQQVRLDAAFLPLVIVAMIAFSIGSSIQVVGDADWVGTDVGISCQIYDLKRMNYLRFGGEYFARVTPPGWEIASTEVDTFGYFGGRETYDLWGYSNLRIARSNDKSLMGVRRDLSVFVDSQVPLFWVRTVPLREVPVPININDPTMFRRGLENFTALAPGMELAGHLDITLQKYDVVRILHGTSDVSILLVRKDVSRAFSDALVRGGATPAGTIRLPLTP